jgi:hypothetical protein
MRSLTVKLTLAFMLVGLIGAVLVAFLVRRSTRREFDRFVLDQNQQVLVTALTKYYRLQGSWKGVEAVFHPGQEFAPSPDPGPPNESRRSLFIIANAGGTVVFGGGPNNVGQKLTRAELAKGVPLDVDGITVGRLILRHLDR